MTSFRAVPEGDDHLGQIRDVYARLEQIEDDGAGPDREPEEGGIAEYRSLLDHCIRLGRSVVDPEARNLLQRAAREIAFRIYEHTEEEDFPPVRDRSAGPGRRAACGAPRREGGLSLEKILVRLPDTGKDLFGREEELALLDDYWKGRRVNLVVIVALGGMGKTSLVNRWLGWMAEDEYRGAERVFAWHFARDQGVEDFFIEALKFFCDPPARGKRSQASVGASLFERGKQLARLVSRGRNLLVLDGLELLQQPPVLQQPPGPKAGSLDRYSGIQILLRRLAALNPGLCIVTTRYPVVDIAPWLETSARQIDLSRLPEEAARNCCRV